MSEKRIFISGVSSGIGKGLAEKYLNLGWQVYGVSRRNPNFENENFHFLSLDLKASGLLENLKLLSAGVTELDLAVLNAGMLGELSTMKNAKENALKEIMEVNLWAQKRCMDALINLVSIKQVVAISSGAAVNGNVGWAGYSLSKAALNMMVKLYAAENPAVHFTAFAPGLVDTSMQDYLCGEGDAQAYPSIARIQSARGTEAMPKPAAFAEKFVAVMPRLLAEPSGSFIDIRKM